MTKSAYYEVTDGEWCQVALKGNTEQCCDCGLVHRINYRIKNGGLEFQVYRDARLTAAARKRFKFSKDDDE